MKLKFLATTALLVVASSTTLNRAAIAAPLTALLDESVKQTASSTVAEDGTLQQKQSADRDRERLEDYRQRERDRHQDAEQQRRNRDDHNSDDHNDDDDDTSWWSDNQDDDAPWWSSDEGWDARQQDRDRQRDARQREQDRRDLQERLDDRRDQDRDRNRDRDDYEWNRDRDRDRNRYDDSDQEDDFRRQWERQQELLQWQWNNLRSSQPSSLTDSTRVDLASLTHDGVVVSIASINGEQALTFTGNNTQQTITLPPGAYRIRFSSREGDRTWKSGYLNIGRTNSIRIVFDQQRNVVQVYNDPYAWMPDGEGTSSDSLF